MSEFSKDIEKFNGIYKLPVNAIPTLNVGVPAAERMASFKNILMEEVHEMDEIIAAQNAGKDDWRGHCAILP